ncbi:AraC family transcriptional regulator [Pseudonocardia sp. TRM90224]|uniref:AraC family transcriptional regulator n=1 Tax=Pseudonocardia sp. TRM90224 TaxID=2812678 RepID=UPI001E494F71|nr:AraC family transcriptional regulator [Pseudonocardia sp. TRM90224]
MPVDPGQDLLGELLRPIRLTGVFHSWWRMQGPWSVEGDTEHRCAVLHHIAEGWCWISTEGTSPIRLEEGDLALFPTGIAHRMSDRPDRRGTPLRALLTERPPGATDRLDIGTEGLTSRILCAGLHYDASAATSLYRALPWIMVLTRAQIEADPLLRDVVGLLTTHRAGAGAGAELVTLRTFEMAFVLALRPLLQDLMDRPDVLVALKHPAISAALLIISTRYAEPWTVDTLAKEVGMSRSAFTASFRELVGEGPAGHLTAWRMREAARLLTESDIAQGSVPAKVGYQSAVGFHTAFRKHFGTTPGEYRRAPTAPVPD